MGLSTLPRPNNGGTSPKKKDPVEGTTPGEPIVGTESGDVVIPEVPMDRHADRIGHRGADFAWIPVNQIRVDPVYQRGLNAHRVNQIAENFDPAAFGVILLSLRQDGSKWALDGQHRVSALQAMYGHDATIKAPCFLYRNLSVAGEASMFYKMNKHRLTPSAADAFKARLAFGDEVALAINTILRDRGLRILFNQAGNLKYGDIKAIAEVEKLYRAGMLETILGLIEESWRGEEGAHRATMMRGIHAFLDVFHDEFFGEETGARLRDDRHRRLVDTMAALPPDDMQRRARHYQTQLNASASNAVARAIHFNFNRGLRGNTRLSPWGEEDTPGAEE